MDVCFIYLFIRLFDVLKSNLNRPVTS